MGQDFPFLLYSYALPNMLPMWKEKTKMKLVQISSESIVYNFFFFFFSTRINQRSYY